MTIEKVLLTEQDVREAVQSWLKTKGIDIKVSSFSKNYSASGGWSIEVDLKSEAVDELTPITTEE